MNQLLFSPRQQKARDNRAAQRINKVQLSNDPLKRHQPSQPPLPGLYDPVSMETEAVFKDPLRPKESEQEQEWKLRQVSRVSMCLSLKHQPPHKVEPEGEIHTRLLSQTAGFNQNSNIHLNRFCSDISVFKSIESSFPKTKAMGRLKKSSTNKLNRKC